MKKTLLTTLMVASLSLPASAEWDNTEKLLFTNYFGMKVKDVHQTINMPSYCTEQNPFIRSWAGKHPSRDEMLLTMTASALTNYYIANKIKNHKFRKGYLVFSNLMYLAVILSNSKK